jgi:hypothetical protein
MNNSTLRESVAALQAAIPSLKQRRELDSLANDVYEAVDDWYHLARHAVENDTRVNYPVRARSELELLTRLREILHTRSSEEQQRYGPLFEAASEMLKQLETVPLPKDGHLGVLKAIREYFGFLRTEYHFEITDEQPMGIRFSSGAVYLKLEYSKNPPLSCSFGPESKDGKEFGIDDLLYMYGDGRYRELPQSLVLDTETDVESWFRFIADVFKRYGRDVLSNQPGIFDRLLQAQTQRDAEFVAFMNEKYGSHP